MWVYVYGSLSSAVMEQGEGIHRWCGSSVVSFVTIMGCPYTTTCMFRVTFPRDMALTKGDDIKVGPDIIRYVWPVVVLILLSYTQLQH